MNSSGDLSIFPETKICRLPPYDTKEKALEIVMERGIGKSSSVEKNVL